MDYTKLADDAAIAATVKNLAERNIEAHVVSSKDEALAKIKEWIPAGVSVMNGSSRTLEEIGFTEYLKSGTHGWNNLHAAILAEADRSKQALLRKQSVISDYYLASLHALAQTGELVIASASGSNIPPVAYTASNIILVVGTQKIVPTLTDALDRVSSFVFPLEDERMKSVGAPGSVLSKELIFRREPAGMGRKFRIILVEESLGF